MSPTLLVAWREYKQYVFSRGFLLFLVMTPVLIIGAVLVLSVLDKSRPQRAFVVVDQAGGFVELIDKELATQHLRQTLSAWNLYVEMAVDREQINPSEIPAPFGASPVTFERLNAFSAAGGVDAASDAIAAYLRAGAPEFSAPKPRFRRLDAPQDVAAAGDNVAAAEALRPYLLGARPLEGASSDGLFAAIVIPEGYGGTGENAPNAEFWSRNLTDPTLEVSVSRALRSVLRRRAAEAMGLSDTDLNVIADINTPMTSFNPDRAVGEAELEDADRFEKVVLPGFMTYILLVIVFAVGNPLLTNTIEERSNKIVEVLLSSVTADQLMVGKLLGIAAVGLTMPAIFVVGGLIASLAGLGGSDFAGQAMGVLFRSNLLFVFVFYFLSAYLIFAMIFLAIGALSNSLQDAQTFMGPLMLIVFAPMPFLVMIFQNPNGLLASVMTFIPIYTPYAVMLRAASDPPLWEIITATLFMLLFASLLARVMGRIFKNNILNNAPPKASEIWRIAKTSQN